VVSWFCLFLLSHHLFGLSLSLLVGHRHCNLALVSLQWLYSAAVVIFFSTTGVVSISCEGRSESQLARLHRSAGDAFFPEPGYCAKAFGNSKPITFASVVVPVRGQLVLSFSALSSSVCS
jgi:hypothetical protein